MPQPLHASDITIEAARAAAPILADLLAVLHAIACHHELVCARRRDPSTHGFLRLPAPCRRDAAS